MASNPSKKNDLSNSWIDERAKGCLILVEFWDHAKDTKELIYCVVPGFVRELTNQKVVLSHWHCPKEDKETRTLNDEIVVIAQATIHRWSYLESLCFHPGPA